MVGCGQDFRLSFVVSVGCDWVCFSNEYFFVIFLDQRIVYFVIENLILCQEKSFQVVNYDFMIIE